MARVFVSHSSADKSQAIRIARALTSAGHVPWIDSQNLHAGQSIPAAVARGLAEADFVLVLLSRAAIASGWVMTELENTVMRVYSKRQHRLLPARLEAVDLPDVIAHLLAVDLFPEARFAAGIERLVAAIAHHLGTEASSPVTDWLPYLSLVAELNGWLNISGIGSGLGAERSATRYPIERLYTPLRTHGAGEVAEGARMAGDASLATLLARRRVLIEGQPGAGKTTFLRLVAALLARDGQGVAPPEGGTWRERWLGLPGGDPAPIPVLLRIAELAPLLEAAPPSRVFDRRFLVEGLARLAEVNEIPVSHEDWRRLLEGGGALLLLDGLDEVGSDALRERVFAVFRDAAASWEKTPIVVASRPTRTEALREMGFEVAWVEPFGPAEVEEFVNRWVKALHDVGADAEIAGPALRYRDELLGAIRANRDLRLLATNPVMLTCLAVVHWNEGRLPKGRARAYRAVLRWLLAARTKSREALGFNDRYALKALARLGLAMLGDEETGAKGKRVLAGLEEAAEAIVPVVERAEPGLRDGEDRRQRARELLDFECRGSGIIEELAGRKLRYWHLTFQEFLAALQLAWRGDGEAEKRDLWPLVRRHLDDAGWKETLALLPGVLIDEGGEGRVDRLLERVLDACPTGDLAERATVVGVVGRLLEPLDAYKYTPPPELHARYRSLLENVTRIFTREGAREVPVEKRIVAAETLARAGDPRLEWPPRFLPVPGTGIELGKYPVTVLEYERFFDQGGYSERRWWDDQGWAARAKHGWTAPDDWDAQLEHPSWPVAGVSWYEAAAYCAWLGGELGRKARLPSEAEWVRAASPDERKYPWGPEEPDVERANFRSNVGKRTPVGVYPAGEGAFGHADLTGNVWEWCADDASLAGWSRGYVDRYGPRGFASRDHSFGLDADSLLSALRIGDPAQVRDRYLGFRVSVVPASTVP